MIRSYIANLQIRLQLVSNCIGDVDKYKEDQIKEVKAKSAEFISKLHKDTQRKFEKIKKTVQKYGDILDLPTTPKQKLQIVEEDFDWLKQIAVHLDKIQKLLPSLKTDHYVKIREQGQNIEFLLTASEVEGDGANGLKIRKYEDKSLYELRSEHREQMNDLMELNNRIVNNLNGKLESLMMKVRK